MNNNLPPKRNQGLVSGRDNLLNNERERRPHSTYAVEQSEKASNDLLKKAELESDVEEEEDQKRRPRPEPTVMPEIHLRKEPRAEFSCLLKSKPDALIGGSEDGIEV